MKKGLSLIEVLVATAIIAVAVYGMILIVGAQELAEIRQRETSIIRHLHAQMVFEALIRERNPIDTHTIAYPTPIPLTNPALGNITVTYEGWTPETSNTMTYRSQLTWTGSTGNNRTNTMAVVIRPSNVLQL